jgi:EAL domain-containing protein (putative c-di-GMP-specific phosphodiesterase class I)
VRELAAGAASLDAGGVEPARIVWELPERRGWPDGAADGIRSALPAGSRIALDDIGEGHADLSRWLRLRPDWIKLARSLVAGLAAEPVRRILIEGLVHAAAASGCQTVAEGVERHEDAACLLDLGVRFGQGYLWGRLGAVAGAEPAQAAR